MSIKCPWQQKSATVLLIFLLLLQTYALLGFYVVPYLIKSRLLPALSAQWKVRLGMGEAAFDPFAFTLTLRDLQLETHDGQPLLQLKEVFARADLASMLRHGQLAIDEIRLSGAQARIELLKSGRFNFSALLPAREKGPARQAERFPVRISRIALEQGRVAFKDHSRSAPFEAELLALDLKLENLTTLPDESARFQLSTRSKAREQLTLEGSFSLAPFRSEGRLHLADVIISDFRSYFPEMMPFEIKGGAATASADYRLIAENRKMSLQIGAADLALKQLKLAQKGRDEPFLEISSVAAQEISYRLDSQRLAIGSLICTGARITDRQTSTGGQDAKRLMRIPWLTVQGIAGRLANKSLTVQRVRSKDAEVSAWLTPEGNLWLPGWALPHPDDGPPAAPKTAGAAPWDVRVNELELENYAMEFQDQTPARTVRFKFSAANLKLTDLSSTLEERMRLDLETGLGKKGRLQATGWIRLRPLQADLKLDLQQIFLRPFEPYLDKVARIDVIRGRANFAGDLAYQRSSDQSGALRITGSGSIQRFGSKDKLQQKDFLKWESLQFNDLLFETGKRGFSITEIIARKPYARVIIGRDGSVNLTGVLSPGPVQAAVSRKASGARKPLPVIVGAIQIIQGEADFADLSLQPNFAAGIHGLNGSIRRLSSHNNARADVLLRGKINKDSPVKIVGQLNPFSPLADTHITVTFTDVDLTTLSPYAGKFAGYRIEKGKLSMDLNYRLRDKKLLGDNSITLDQLVLGERVDSPQATTLPIRFAIALLKDAEGKIDLKLPVSGNLDHPRLGFGDILSNAMSRLIGKLVGSPFVLLGSFLNSGSEELGYVSFGPGDAALSAEEKAKLTRLSAALKQRPLLQLDIKGVAHAKRDRAALAEKALLEQLRNTKSSELRGTGRYSADAGDLSSSDEDYARLLVQLYRSRHHAVNPQSRDVDAPYSYGELIKVKQQLLKNWQIGEVDYRTLAQARSKAIRDYLVQEAGISERRIYLLDVKVARSEEQETRTLLTLNGP